jgi:hypothetical protein
VLAFTGRAARDAKTLASVVFRAGVRLTPEVAQSQAWGST